MTPKEKIAWLRLARTENVGPATFRQLLAQFGSADKALEAIPELAKKGGLKRKLSIPPSAQIEDELYQLGKMGAQVLCLGEADYPKMLSYINDAPAAITIHGHAHLLHKPCVAIVGARNASLNGRRFAERLAREISEGGYVVVSGLASGIDAAAHTGAMATGTVGVIAGGIDIVYPAENTALHRQTIEQGCLVAEMPLSTPINARLFPRRNRIVSGLSKGILVIEAAMQSGSLITARLAGEQGREVMAVPGSPLDPRSTGTNRLIKDGASMIESADDVLTIMRQLALDEPPASQYELQLAENIEESTSAALQDTLIEALSYSAVPVDELVRLCHSHASAVWAALLELELAGRIIRVPGNQVALVAPSAEACEG